jgi:hypothetical protein
MCLSAVVPAYAEPDIHSLSRALASRHRRLSLCSLPVRRKPREFDLRRLLGQVQDLAACALRDPDAFSLRWRGFLGRRPAALCYRYKISLFSIHGHQICNHLSSNRQRRSIGVPFLLFVFINQGQTVIVSGRQLCRFHQHTLDMLVALPRKWCAHHLLR